MLYINMQAMKYSLRNSESTVYETDDDGNILYEGYTDSEGNFIAYLDEDGNEIPKIKSEAATYNEPIDFEANIAFSGGKAEMQDYGFNSSDYDAILLTHRKQIPLAKGSLIWLDSDVGYNDDETVDETSADFIVIGIKPALCSTKYVLKAVVK